MVKNMKKLENKNILLNELDDNINKLESIVNNLQLEIDNLKLNNRKKEIITKELNKFIINNFK